jgi:hypothetical protein
MFISLWRLCFQSETILGVTLLWHSMHCCPLFVSFCCVPVAEAAIAADKKMNTDEVINPIAS